MIEECHSRQVVQSFLKSGTIMRNACLQAIFGFLLFIGAAASAHAQRPPSADKVFQLTVAQGAEGALVLNRTIAPGNYLYRDKIRVTGPQGAPVVVHTPAGEMKDDPSFGETEVYHRQVQATVAAKSLSDRSSIECPFRGVPSRASATRR
jgi:thiol:disulfide interchange protein DsbD